jgi:hypothetical protein
LDRRTNSNTYSTPPQAGNGYVVDAMSAIWSVRLSLDENAAEAVKDFEASVWHDSISYRAIGGFSSLDELDPEPS